MEEEKSEYSRSDKNPTGKLINDFPEKPIIKAKELTEMNLSKEIIDAIYFHKGVLISELRSADVNNSGMISPNEIMIAFIKSNIHKDLTSQLIMDIINIYLPAKSDKIDYMRLISYFLKDLKTLIDNKSTLNKTTTNGFYGGKGNLNGNKNQGNKTTFGFYNTNAKEILPKLVNDNLSQSHDCKKKYLKKF